MIEEITITPDVVEATIVPFGRHLEDSHHDLSFDLEERRVNNYTEYEAEKKIFDSSLASSRKEEVLRILCLDEDGTLGGRIDPFGFGSDSPMEPDRSDSVWTHRHENGGIVAKRDGYSNRHRSYRYSKVRLHREFIHQHDDVVVLKYYRAVAASEGRSESRTVEPRRAVRPVATEAGERDD